MPRRLGRARRLISADGLDLPTVLRDRRWQPSGRTVTDRDGEGDVLPVTYTGVVPDPFRGGREIVLQGTVANGVFNGERDTLVTKCPSKFSEKKNH